MTSQPSREFETLFGIIRSSHYVPEEWLERNDWYTILKDYSFSVQVSLLADRRLSWPESLDDSCAGRADAGHARERGRPCGGTGATQSRYIFRRGNRSSCHSQKDRHPSFFAGGKHS